MGILIDGLENKISKNGSLSFLAPNSNNPAVNISGFILDKKYIVRSRIKNGSSDYSESIILFNNELDLRIDCGQGHLLEIKYVDDTTVSVDSIASSTYDIEGYFLLQKSSNLIKGETTFEDKILVKKDTFFVKYPIFHSNYDPITYIYYGNYANKLVRISYLPSSISSAYNSEYVFIEDSKTTKYSLPVKDLDGETNYYEIAFKENSGFSLEVTVSLSTATANSDLDFTIFYPATEKIFISGDKIFNPYINGDMLVENGNVSIKGDAAVNGNVSIKGDAAVSGNLSIGGNIPAVWVKYPKPEKTASDNRINYTFSEIFSPMLFLTNIKLEGENTEECKLNKITLLEGSSVTIEEAYILNFYNNELYAYCRYPDDHKISNFDFDEACYLSAPL